jgi:hypothetical protein
MFDQFVGDSHATSLTPSTTSEDDESGSVQTCSMSCNNGERKVDFPRKRAVLTNQQAAEIFQLRLSFGILDSTRQHLFTSRSAQVSKMYGVSPKAVRDIWNMRTWRHATKHLWTEQDCLREGDKPLVTKPEQIHTIPNDLASRIVGRPKGAKDSKPRKLRGTFIGCVSSRDCYPDTPESVSYHMQLAEELGIPVLSTTVSDGLETTLDDIEGREFVDEIRNDELLNRWFPFFLPLPVEIDIDA